MIEDIRLLSECDVWVQFTITRVGGVVKEFNTSDKIDRSAAIVSARGVRKMVSEPRRESIRAGSAFDRGKSRNELPHLPANEWIVRVEAIPMHPLLNLFLMPVFVGVHGLPARSPGRLVDQHGYPRGQNAGALEGEFQQIVATDKDAIGR
jgi:hypothetical protein